MRRLTLLLLALAIGLAGARLLHDGDAILAVRLRDAAALFAVAALLFAVNALRPAVRRPQAVSRTWPAPGRVLALTGLACAAVGGFLFGMDAAGTLVVTSRLTLWLLGLVLLVTGVFWPGTVQRYSLPGFRWQQDADGAFTRVPVDDARAPDRVTATVRLPFQRIWLVTVIVLGVLLRAWPLITAPASCAGNECAAAMALVNGDAAGPAATFNLLNLLAQLLHVAGLGALLSVRLAALAIGAATLLTAWPALRRLSSPAMGVVGVALLAVSPLHILAGHGALPWLPVPLFLLLALGAGQRGQRTGQRRDWTVSGLALGAVVLTAPALLPGVFILTVVIILVGVAQRAGWIETWRPTPLLLGAGAFFVTVLPVVAIAGTNALAPISPTGAMANAALPWTGLALTLAVLGLGLALRYVRLPELATGAAALLILAATAWWTRAGAQDGLLAVLAPALLLATMAVDAIFEPLVRTWQVLVRPTRLALGMAALLLVPLIWAGVRGLETADVAGPGQADAGARAMIAAAGDALLAAADADTVPDTGPLLVYLPADVLATAEAQIGLGQWLDAGRIQPLTLANILDGVDHTQRLFIPPARRDWLDVLHAYFPRSVEIPELDPTSGTLRHWIVGITPEPEDGPGVTAVYADAAADVEVVTRVEPSLDIALDAALPADLDATWAGALRVDTAGSYRFDVTGLGPDDIFTLLLDGKLILDTSLNRATGIEVLAAGVHPLEARLRSAAKPAHIAVRWATDDGPFTPIPGDALFARTLPALGLEATYFANANFQPPGVDLRRDLFMAPAPTEVPTSILWRGKLAANRAGEYLLGVVADGAAEIALDGAPLAANGEGSPTASGEGGAPGYAEGVAYLDAGWHDLEVRFAPPSHVHADLLWQPPGGQPALSPCICARRKVRSHPGRAAAVPAALTDPRLERDGFALPGRELRQPQTVRLAENRLPLLGQLAGSQQRLRRRVEPTGPPHGAAVDPAPAGSTWRTRTTRVAIFTPDGARLGDILDRCCKSRWTWRWLTTARSSYWTRARNRCCN
ncbi:MAG: glycosyltransferase family 39 protein [Caldilineaceae bacterium]|nr:glycosyltransferase family 39 protein [Caldilineaceae bacterium]